MNARQALGRPTFGLLALFLATTISAMAFATALRFSGMATRPRGIAAGSILFVVGCVAGSIFGGQRGPREFIIGISLLFFVGIITNLVQDLGDELLLWSFHCMCAGLLVGALYRCLWPHSDYGYSTPAESGNETEIENRDA